MEEKTVKENTKEIVKENMQDKLKKLTEELEQAVQEFMSGEKYMVFLSSMAKFHKFSLNNQILIAMQKKGCYALCILWCVEKEFWSSCKEGREGNPNNLPGTF